MKETNSLIKLKLVDEIIIISIWQSGLKEEEEIDERRKVYRIKLFSRNFKSFFKGLSYLEFMLRVFIAFRKEKFKFVNCHSLLVLPIGVLLKKYGDVKTLIYDPHELETERVGLKGVSQKMTKWLERTLISYVDKTIVVCRPIADWYAKEYGLKYIHVIQNMPIIHKVPKIKPSLLRDKFKIAETDFIFIYQGVLENERGIDNLLTIFSKVPSNKHIIFMGYGNSEKLIQKYTESYINIHFQPAVNTHNIISYTSSADIGIFFIPGDVCLSYQYCLPNKFGEYLMSGLPVLVSSSLGYLSEIVVKEGLGWAVDAKNENELTDCILKIDKKNVLETRNNVLNYSEKIGWEFEEDEYLKVY